MMHRFVSSGVRTVFKLQSLSTANLAMLGSVQTPCIRLFSKKAGAKASEKEENTDSTVVEEEESPMVDMSIPMEQLSSAAERFNRIKTLQKKPYQLGNKEINKYFKSINEDEDLTHLEDLFAYCMRKNIQLKNTSIYGLVKTMLTFKQPSEVFQFICKNSKALSKCDKKTFNLIIDAAAEAGDFKRVSRVVHYSYKKWKTDASYLEHAVDILLTNKHLGTAFTLMKSFDASFAPVNAELMERMLNDAVNAKDRFRAEGVYLMLKDCWKIDKPYEIVGEPERPWKKEKEESAETEKPAEETVAEEKPAEEKPAEKKE